MDLLKALPQDPGETYREIGNMTIQKVSIITLLILAGCSEEQATMPEVNIENCKHENIMALEPESLRKEFASKCGGENPFKASKSPKSWGDI
jgi:entry exclusion lipoprotein TrbK